MRLSWVGGETPDIGARIRATYSEKVVLILGPHVPGLCLRRLERLRDQLREDGFNAHLVRDLPDEDEDGRRMDSREKSFYWIEKSDYGVYVHFAEGITDGLAIEMSYMKDKEHLVPKSQVLIERSQQEDTDEYLSEMLTHNEGWVSIGKASFGYGRDDDMLALSQAYLGLRFREEMMR